MTNPEAIAAAIREARQKIPSFTRWRESETGRVYRTCGIVLLEKSPLYVHVGYVPDTEPFDAMWCRPVAERFEEVQTENGAVPRYTRVD